METSHVTVDRAAARELYQKYKRDLHWSQPIDRECMRAYQLLAQGRLIIKALESVVAAGVKTSGPDAGFPKLALCRASAVSCKVNMHHNGSAVMHAGDTEPRSRGWQRGGGNYQSRNCFNFENGTFPSPVGGRPWRAEALMPTPPLHLRPKRGLDAYHVLWEAEWTKIAPHDPYLLRRIGKADLWLVVASWDLTEVERAVLSTRLSV